MRNTLSPFLREETMQQIFTGNAREKSDAAPALTPVERIENYLASSSIVLFMKGSADFPQCGFSGRVTQILNYLGVDFKDINVLADQAVRDGIKAYTNWPTIPQLYVKGEFVGGADIIAEMFQSGDLQTFITEKGVASHKTQAVA